MAFPDPQVNIHLQLPEPPSINTMLGYAKAWKGRKYYVMQQRWRDEALEMLPAQEDIRKALGSKAAQPWKRWAITAIHFRLWNRRDPLELLAGLKWAADLLIDEGWVEEDDADHLVDIAFPTQEIDRKNRGVSLTIQLR